MLVYVRRENIESIYAPIPNESVPKHLRDFIKQNPS